MSAAKPKKARTPLELLFALGSSYGLSCMLLLFLFLLTFLGTIEQAEYGLYDVQKKYFESAFLVHWLFDRVPIPLPGAYLLMILLAVNLSLGGLVKIRKSEATAGVIVIHVGIIVLLLAGFVKLKFSDDGFLTLYEEGRAPATLTRSDEYQSYHEWEIAIFDGSQTRNVVEHVIPGEEFLFLPEGFTRTFKSEELPFDLEVTRPMRNCEVLQVGPAGKPKNPAIGGVTLKRLQLAKENENNVAGIYVTVVEGEGRTQAILHGRTRYPFAVQAGGKGWGIDLRKKRYKMPFTISLQKFTRELHPGTNSPKVFMSEVRKIQDEGEDYMRIEMNEPLRHDGLTLFQASWGPADAPPGTPLFSTFAVVRNPSDYWPIYSCIIITIGLLMAFVRKLVRYSNSQAIRRAKREAAEA